MVVGMFIVVILLWILLDCKTSRSDGVYIKKIHPYRRLMPFVMLSRNESVVYFDMEIQAEALQDYIKNRPDINFSHCIVGATALTLIQNPELNRFVSGNRVYQRKEVVLSFSMKRKKKESRSKIAVVKQAIDPKHSFDSLCQTIAEQIDVERSDTVTYADKEFQLFGLVPRFALRFFVWFFKLLDHYNLLMPSFIENDGLYCSAFIANLGSLGMRPGYHHLYEWGNCPLFIMCGALEDKLVLEEGVVKKKTILPLRFSFDERINDGLTARYAMNSLKYILEHPKLFLKEGTESSMQESTLSLSKENDRI